MIERQIRYNFRTNSGDQVPVRHRWTFFIVNEPKEIRRIRERIYNQLQPIDNLRDLDSGLIRGSGGLHYDFFSFSTDKSKIERPDEIYLSRKFKKDRDLWERGEVSLDRYLNSILDGKK